MGEMRNAYKMFGKPEGKTQLRRPRRRWKDNINIVLKEIGWMWTGLISLGLGTCGGLM
jgi:hypothetical protein